MLEPKQREVRKTVAERTARIARVIPFHRAAQADHIFDAAILAVNSLGSATPGSRNDGAATDAHRSGFRIIISRDSHGYKQFTLLYNKEKIIMKVHVCIGYLPGEIAMRIL